MQSTSSATHVRHALCYLSQLFVVLRWFYVGLHPIWTYVKLGGVLSQHSHLQFSQSAKRVRVLELRGTSTDKIGGPAQWWKIWWVKISEVPISSTSIFLQASKMFFIPYRGTKLYKARNIFRIHIVVIKVILRNFFVETMKITPFNGSIFLRTQRHFLLVVATIRRVDSSRTLLNQSIDCDTNVHYWSSMDEKLGISRKCQVISVSRNTTLSMNVMRCVYEYDLQRAGSSAHGFHRHFSTLIRSSTYVPVLKYCCCRA